MDTKHKKPVTQGLPRQERPSALIGAEGTGSLIQVGVLRAKCIIRLERWHLECQAVKLCLFKVQTPKPARMFHIQTMIPFKATSISVHADPMLSYHGKREPVCLPFSTPNQSLLLPRL